jgi:hypothetical protein
MKKKFVQGIIFKTIIDTTKKDPPPITSLMALMVPPKTGNGTVRNFQFTANHL